jgi:hypothetical protein
MATLTYIIEIYIVLTLLRNDFTCKLSFSTYLPMGLDDGPSLIGLISGRLGSFKSWRKRLKYFI